MLGARKQHANSGCEASCGMQEAHAGVRHAHCAGTVIQGASRTVGYHAAPSDTLLTVTIMPALLYYRLQLNMQALQHKT